MGWQILLILFYVFCGFLVAQGATLATTLYLHRSSTHKSVKFHPVVEFFFQLTLWIETGINRKEWVAVHLCHHAHTDKEGDPHSPILLNFWKVQIKNPLLYHRAAKRPEVMEYGRNVELSWAERNLFFSAKLGLSLGVMLAIWIFGWWQGLLVSVSHAFFYLQLNSLVNAYCHLWGYKLFPDADAFNSHWVAWITCGEGYHNKHHKKPSSAQLSTVPNEVDIGWGVIRFLQILHLARTSA